MATLKEVYSKQGWVGPLEIMDRERTRHYRQCMLEADQTLDLMNSDYRCKSNVLFPWVDEISRTPRLVGYLTELLGPNFHCWDTLFWIKKPGTNKVVSYHQDSTYWNFDNPEKAVTAWFAFDDVSPDHGSIEYVVGSHETVAKHHDDIKTENNLLMRGQTVQNVNLSHRVKTSVPAGHVLLHSPFIVHGSDLNKTDSVRLAMGMIFASTECKPRLSIGPESTVMVSGTDGFNFMMHDPQPTGNWDLDLVNWRAAYDRQHLNYYKLNQRADESTT